MCKSEELTAILKRVDEHLAHKEGVSSNVLYSLINRIKVMEEKLDDCMEQQKQREETQKKMTEVISAWNSAKGFRKVTKLLFVFVISLSAFMASLGALWYTFKNFLLK